VKLVEVQFQNKFDSFEDKYLQELLYNSALNNIDKEYGNFMLLYPIEKYHIKSDWEQSSSSSDNDDMSISLIKHEPVKKVSSFFNFREDSCLSKYKKLKKQVK
jgi:hypothetical protein